MTADRHEEFEANSAAYALDALDQAERRAFEAHLSTCARCQADVVEYRRVMAGLARTIEPLEPPASLKMRTLLRATGASADSTRTSQQTVTPIDAGRRKAPGVSASWLAVAASLTLAVGAGIYALSLRSQVDSLRRMLAASAAQAQSLRAELAAVRNDSGRLVRTINVLTSPDLLRVDLAGSRGAPSATGRAFWSRSRGLLFSADHLPALEVGRIYQIWIVLPQQSPVSAGLLTVDRSGSGSVTAALPVELAVPRATNVTVAITNEPAAGSPGPTSPILLAGSAKTEQ